MKLVVEGPDGKRLVFEGEPAELADVATRLAEGTARTPHSSAPNSEPITKRYWSDKTARRFWALLWGEQSKLVKFVVSKGRPTYEEIQKHMGYGQQRLSGVLSGITRNAQAATGDRLARVIDWKFTEDSERRYFVDADALPFLKEVVK